MYQQHFGLTRLPFQTPAHSDELFASAALLEAQTRLKHLFDLRGIGLLTGEPGCGKTSAVRKVTDRLDSGQHRIAYLARTTGSVIDTYQSLGWALGLDTPRSRATACQAIRLEIVRLNKTGQLPVLILDEAQNLHHDVLEELRLLTNYGMDSQRCLCLLLVGQSELRRRMSMAVCEAFAQRIVMRYQVPGLQRDELDSYLQHALKLAGCERPLFEPAACQALFQASHGLPRQVSALAHYSLAAAALGKARRVSTDHVQSACEEIRP